MYIFWGFFPCLYSKFLISATKLLNYELVKSEIFRKEIKIFKLTSRLLQIYFILEWNTDSWLLFVLSITSTGRLKRKEIKKMWLKGYLSSYQRYYLVAYYWATLGNPKYKWCPHSRLYTFYCIITQQILLHFCYMPKKWERRWSFPRNHTKLWSMTLNKTVN